MNNSVEFISYTELRKIVLTDVNFEVQWEATAIAIRDGRHDTHPLTYLVNSGPNVQEITTMINYILKKGLCKNDYDGCLYAQALENYGLSAYPIIQLLVAAGFTKCKYSTVEKCDKCFVYISGFSVPEELLKILIAHSTNPAIGFIATHYQKRITELTREIAQLHCSPLPGSEFLTSYIDDHPESSTTQLIAGYIPFLTEKWEQLKK